MTQEGSLCPKVRNSPLTALVAAGLAVLTFLTFFGVWRNGFIDYDDNTYVFLNPNVIHGLSWQTVQWAFGYVNACHWVPITWLSHAMDCQLYGLNPAGHHVTNLLLHTVNVMLLFVALRFMTGAVWRSAIVAALFAVHPRNVESVAWIAERKDVLSGFFFMLTLLAYTRYAQLKAEAAGQNVAATSWAARFYGLSLLTFTLGLMSKSMLVTVPFLFLVLDFWPLGRLEAGLGKARFEGFVALVKEKAPFFALSGGACLITYLAQDTTAAGIGMLPLNNRLANGLLAIMAYFRQTVWPVNLSVYYPPAAVSLFQSATLVAALVIVLLTIVVLLLWRRYPYVPAGWFWYFGMLVPVSGIVQVGSMVQADRFTYLPSIGLFILLTWGFAGVVSRRQVLRFATAACAAAAVAALAVAAHAQVSVWRNTHTLFAHANQVTHNNYVARTMLAKDDLDQGRLSECISNVQEVLVIAPKFPSAEYLLGSALQMQGKMQEAIPHLEESVGPEVAVPGKARLVISYLDVARLAEAEQGVIGLMRMVGGNADLWLMRAALLKEEGRTAEALQVFNGLMEHNPKFQLDTPTMNYELAELYSLQGSNRQAVAYYTRALEISPQYTNALNNCAWILATDSDDQVRDGKRAVELAQRACELSGWQQPVLMGTLAAAYAEAGRFEDAVKMAERARDLAQKQGNGAVAKRNGELIQVYRQNKAFREK